MNRDYTLVYRVDTTQAIPGFNVMINGVHAVTSATGQAAGAINSLNAQINNMGGAANACIPGMNGLNVSVQEARKSFLGLTQESVATMAAFKGFEFVVGIFKDMGEQVNKIRQDLKDAADEAMRVRGEFRELANLKGKDGPGIQVPAQAIEFGMEVGMTPDQAARFLEQYEGSSPAGMQKGNVGDGKHKDEKQDEYEKRMEPVKRDIATQAAKFGQRTGLETKTAGDMGGVFSQYGRIRDGAEAATKFGQVAYGLNEGRGNLEPLMRSLLNTAGAVIDENQGPVGGLPELAAILGVMSTHHQPKEAGTYVKKAIRELREFGGKQGPALQEMGITGNDSHMEALGKLKKQTDEANAKGEATDIFLQRKGFNDAAGRQALTEELNDFGVIQARIMKAKMLGYSDVEKKNDNFFKKDLVGKNMMLNAAEKGQAFLRGQEQNEIQMARKAAVIRMRDAGNLNNAELAMADKIADAGGILPGLGIPDSFSQRVDEEARQGLVTALRNAGKGDQADKIIDEMDNEHVVIAGPDEAFAGTKVVKPAMSANEREKYLAQQMHAHGQALLNKGVDFTGGTGGVKAKMHALARDPKDQAAINKAKDPKPFVPMLPPGIPVPKEPDPNAPKLINKPKPPWWPNLPKGVPVPPDVEANAEIPGRKAGPALANNDKGAGVPAAGAAAANAGAGAGANNAGILAAILNELRLQTAKIDDDGGRELPSMYDRGGYERA